jgi:hypothetical protein
MRKKRMPKSLRKHIRTKKAEIRKLFDDKKEQEQKIKQLLDNFTSVKK